VAATACPKCGAKFASKARGGYATLTMFRGGALDTKVRCPTCEHVFQPRRARSVALKIALGLLVAIALGVAIYALIIASTPAR